MSEEERNKEYGAMLGRISAMLPCEFFQSQESTTEDAVALLLERYYDKLANKMWEHSEKRREKP